MEGRGAATIHEVVVSKLPQAPIVSASPTLAGLLHKKERTQKALERCEKSLASLETYLGTLNVQSIDVSQIGHVMKSFDTEGEKLDDKVLELGQQLRTIENEIKVERESLTGPSKNDKLGLQAAIGIFAASEGEVEIALIYGELSCFRD